jgi:type IV secretory pathway VirD2 relaxase
VHAARSHLARRHSEGVEHLLWEEHDKPLPDVDAVRKTIASIRQAHAAGDQPAAEDLAAALVVLRAARLDMDRLEVELIEAVRDAGLAWAAIAAVLDLPDEKAARQRYEELRPRLDAPVDHIDPPTPHVGDG